MLVGNAASGRERKRGVDFMQTPGMMSKLKNVQNWKIITKTENIDKS
jgi:hypothetical protein